jgi:hypothetical protein
VPIERAAELDAVCGHAFRADVGAARAAKHRNRNEHSKEQLLSFGMLETERFITSIKSDSFDYTEWRKELWKDKTVDEIHGMAVEFENKKYHT